jgi:hypothetical protein
VSDACLYRLGTAPGAAFTRSTNKK